MYEEKKLRLDIDWKTLLIRLAILLIIVFIICFIVFRPKKNNNLLSLNSNIETVKEAAITYYKNNFTLEKIGDYDKVTLKELIKENLLENQKDSNDNKCDKKRSYAYLTKTRDDEFVLKINMMCGDNEEAKIFNLTTKDLTIIASKEEKEEVSEEIKKDEILVENEKVPEEEIVTEEPKSEIADNTEEIREEAKDEIKEEVNTSIAINDNVTCQNNKILRYKHIKYGEWTVGNRTGSSIENSTTELTYYNYCKNGECITDLSSNSAKYEGFTSTFNHTETVSIYRYIYVVWSNSCCVKGFINTGITECR